MAVSSGQARELALALPAASEAPHFHRQAFRTPRKSLRLWMQVRVIST